MILRIKKQGGVGWGDVALLAPLKLELGFQIWWYSDVKNKILLCCCLILYSTHCQLCPINVWLTIFNGVNHSDLESCPLLLCCEPAGGWAQHSTELARAGTRERAGNIFPCFPVDISITTLQTPPAQLWCSNHIFMWINAPWP